MGVDGRSNVCGFIVLILFMAKTLLELFGSPQPLLESIIFEYEKSGDRRIAHVLNQKHPSV